MSELILGNRLWNFRRLVKAAGGNNAVAGILDVRPSYITAIAGPNPNRTIGDRMAAKVERCFGLKPGSLDEPPPAQVDHTDPYIAEIVSTMANTTQDDKEFVLAVSQWVAARSTANNVVRLTKDENINLGKVAGSVISYDKGDIVTGAVPGQNMRSPKLTMKRHRGNADGADKP